MTTPWLDDATIDAMCEGFSQPAAKVRHLRGMGLTVTQKPNRKPLVLRSNVERIYGGIPQAVSASEAAIPASAATPNRDKFRLLYGGKGARV